MGPFKKNGRHNSRKKKLPLWVVEMTFKFKSTNKLKLKSTKCLIVLTNVRVRLLTCWSPLSKILFRSCLEITSSVREIKNLKNISTCLYKNVIRHPVFTVQSLHLNIVHDII